MSLETITPGAEPEAPPEPVSIADHAASFSPEAQRADPESTPPPEPIPANETPAQRTEREQRRDKQSGQYQNGYKRHRAKSQQASPEDVDAINEYTRRIKAVEEQFGAEITQKPNESPRAYEMRRRAELLERRIEAKRADATPPPAARVPPPQMPSAPTQGDPEPNEADEKYADNYVQFLKDQASWAGRDAYRRATEAERHQRTEWERTRSLGMRMQAAAQKYPDFSQVALQPVPWAPGSVVDQFIHEDDAGAEILYHLQSHPAERDALGQMSEFHGRKFLALLSQRLASSSSESAGTNGAATGARTVVLPPRPPTPLRTEAQRATPAAPPTDGSLSIAEHARHFGQKRR